MASPANVVRVPKPGRGAYNPNRSLEKNLLIKSQVEHFYEADQKLPLEFQTGIEVATIRTEGQASAYIRRVTEAIHKSGGAEKVQKAT
jgi:hypothetical protein